MANHKSIRDEQELVLRPAYDKTRRAVPVTGVFGANASGKSTLLDGLQWMRAAVLDSFAAWQPGSGVPRTPFRLDPDDSRPSGYAIEVDLGGVRHQYGFEVDDDQVREEWLYSYPHHRRRVVFERRGSSIRLGSTLPDARSREETLGGLTRDNTLLLSVAALTNQREALPIYQWLRSGVRPADHRRSVVVGELITRVDAGAQGRPAIMALIRSADLGIHDVQVVHGADEEAVQDLQADLDRALKHHAGMRQTLAELQSSVAELADPPPAVRQMLRFLEDDVIPAAAVDEQRAATELRRAKAAPDEPPTLLFLHNGGSNPLEFAAESAGTRTWLALLSATLDVLDQGGLLVVDELDMSLHPHLSARLVNLFRDPATNPRTAQLLFTSHDSTLMDEDTLSRDEIWFVEKDPDTGATRLFPLTDFHPRKNENTERRYLAGSYGAVPVVSEAGLRDVLREPPGADNAA